MTTLTAEDRDLVLWVLNKPRLSLEGITDEGLPGLFVVALTLDQVRTLAALVEDQRSSIEEDISRCLSDSSSSVLDRYHCALGTILDSLNSAKPLTSEPSPAADPSISSN